jgi:spatacsin
MDLASEDPAILQLNKWDPSEIQTGLSEFREAFISPTREILLLHSLQKEALLFPLVKGDCCSLSYKGLLGLTYSSLHTDIHICKTV